MAVSKFDLILKLNHREEMGRCQRAGTSKNKKVTENSTLLVFWSVGLGFSLKNYFSSLKLVRSKIIFVLSCHNNTEMFKNSVRKK